MTISSAGAATTAFRSLDITQLPQLLVGADTLVPTLGGETRYVNFDNAASTPTFKPIVDSVTEFLKWYSNVHRGTGFKSQMSSHVFEQSRDLVAEFVGADLRSQVVIFTKNSTEALNKLANRIPFQPGDVVLTTVMEHHSNELPWRRVAVVDHVDLNPDGTISKEHFQSLLKQHAGRVRLVAVTGASNVTGYLNDIEYFATEAHRAGARILVDGAQLVPHRQVRMKPSDPQRRIDYLVFSAHKMYAPFGVGVLVSDRATFEQGEPETVGGGVVDIVTLEEAYWADLPDKEEAGTPDIVGVVALGKAIKLFESLGWEAIIRHEADLTRYALAKLNRIDTVDIYGDREPSRAEGRLGVISFNVRGVPHALTAAILGYEGGIGVRSGCFCAHPYVKAITHTSEQRFAEVMTDIRNRDRSNVPGMVRVSFGLYNTTAEIDRLVELVRRIAEGTCHQDYVLNRESGEYSPRNLELPFEKYFRL